MGNEKILKVYQHKSAYDSDIFELDRRLSTVYETVHEMTFHGKPLLAIQQHIQPEGRHPYDLVTVPGYIVNGLYDVSKETIFKSITADIESTLNEVFDSLEWLCEAEMLELDEESQTDGIGTTVYPADYFHDEIREKVREEIGEVKEIRIWTTW